MPSPPSLSPSTGKDARRDLPIMLPVMALLALAPASAAAEAPSSHNLVLSLESYIDDATLREETNLANLQMDQDETEVGRGPIVGSVSLVYLTPLTDIFLVGGGARYLGSYRYELDDAEEDDQATLVGRMLEAFARAEFRVSVIEGLQLVPALELGVPLLFASGALQSRLDGLETQGYNVNSLPRVGFLLGGEVGARYELEPWRALRAGFGLLHEKVFFFDASTEDDIGQTSSSLSLVRLRLGLGAEASF